MHLHSAPLLDPKWEKTDHIIDQWLQERQKLLVLFSQLCALAPFTPQEATTEPLTAFCQVLIDYVSAGQFEVFEKIFEANEQTGSPSLDKESLIALFKTTMNALNFSDHYQKTADYTGLSQALSLLGERLADRMELEDKLIDLYMQATHALGAES